MFFVAIVIWMDRKIIKLQGWETLCWILIAMFTPFFLGVPLYWFYRSTKLELNRINSRLQQEESRITEKH
jgi:cbb3-type cytochrome oxidase subunit 3